MKKLKYILAVILIVVFSTGVMADYSNKPIIGSWQQIVKFFASGSCNGLLKSDGTCPATTDIYNPANVTATGGTISGANITVGAGKTLDVSDGTLTLADLQITVAKVSGAAATADLAEDLSTASHSMYKDSAGNITDIVTAIDAHAANTTITLIPGVCATIHNSAQGDANAVSTLPAVATGLCFTGLVVTTEDDKTFRLNAAAANTICLGATCGKDDIGFATGQNTKGGMFKCIGIVTDWFCHTITGTVDAGDL